jgi:hypothetical protein
MKKRLTLTLSVEVVKYIKTKAKERKITASRFVEELLLDFIANEEKEQEKLKKVS